MQDLGKIWAAGRPLTECFQEVLDATPFTKIASGSAPTKAEKREAPILTNLAEAAKKTAAQLVQLRRRGDAIETLRNSLVCAETTLVGRRFLENGDAVLELIRSDFWVGAEIFPERESAHSGRQAYDKIRQLPDLIPTSASAPSSQPTTQPVAEALLEVGEAERGKPGPKSHEDDILSAIAECVRENRRHWTQPLRLRVSNYKKNLRTRGVDCSKRGFSDKTFEKWEGVFKSKPLL